MSESVSGTAKPVHECRRSQIDGMAQQAEHTSTPFNHEVAHEQCVEVKNVIYKDYGAESIAGHETSQKARRLNRDEEDEVEVEHAEWMSEEGVARSCRVTREREILPTNGE